MNFSDNKTRRILDELRHRAITAKEIFDEIFATDPDTFKVTKRILGYMTPPKRLTPHELKRLEEKRFYTLLAKLRKEGVVKRDGVGSSALYELTKNGLKKLIKYSELKPPIHLAGKKYIAKKINGRTLVIFDIPESLKHYRNWIRHRLNSFGFTMLQKSVFIGSCELPSDFLYDLRESNLLKYVHIFEISKGGSLDENS